MSHVRLLLYRGRELDIVSQAESVEPLAPLLVDLDRASQAMAVLEAADQLALEREPNPELYRMLVGVLRTIAARPGPLVVPAFFWKLLAAEGLRPELDACVRCGGAEPDVTLVAFDLAEGGVLCRSCRSGTAISPAALALLRGVLGGRLNEALGAPSRRRPTRSASSPPAPSSTTSNAASAPSPCSNGTDASTSCVCDGRCGRPQVDRTRDRRGP